MSAAPLAYQAWGTDQRGAPWAVLLHGVGGGHAAWAAQGPALAAAGWRVVAVDLPGYGASAPVQPYTLASMAQQVLALLDHIGAASAWLVGHSMGGMLAKDIAASVPQRVAALALCNTSPAFGKPDGAWQAEFLRQRFAPLDAGLGMPGLAAQLVPTMLGPQATAQAQAQATALMSGVPEATYRAALAALVAFDRRAALGRIGVPTLVLTGAQDRAAPPEVAQGMAQRIAGSTLAVLPGAGHLAPLEAPEVFNAALMSFAAHLPHRTAP